jgi:hypothetical protein
MALATRSYHVDLRNRKLSPLYHILHVVQGEDDIYNFTQKAALYFSRIFVLWF